MSNAGPSERQASLPFSSSVEFDPIRRGPRLSDRVADSIRSAIISHRLAPGTPLPSQRELIEQCGVSRTVIREAVGALVATGLVEVRSGSGLRVAKVDEGKVADALSWYIRGGRIEYPKVHEIRRMIEIEMAGLAAERRTDADVETLLSSHDAFRCTVDLGADAAAHADFAFHEAVARSTDNELFSVILGSMADALIEIRRDLLRRGRGRQTIREHARVLRAIVGGDAPAARAAMSAHLTRVKADWARQSGSQADSDA